MFDACDAIKSRIGLAQLYCQWARYADALNMVEEALVRLRGEQVSTMVCLEATFADILAVKGRVYMEEEQRRSCMEEGRGKGVWGATSVQKSTASFYKALALFEEALEIRRSLQEKHVRSKVSAIDKVHNMFL